MRKVITLVATIALLSGCANSHQETESEISGDATGCLTVQKLDAEVNFAILNENSESLEEVRTKFDKESLQATGEIQERLKKVVANISDDLLTGDTSEYDTAVKDLIFACEEYDGFVISSDHGKE